MNEKKEKRVTGEVGRWSDVCREEKENLSKPEEVRAV